MEESSTKEGSNINDKKIIVENKSDKPSDADFTFVKSQAALHNAGAQRSLNFQFSVLNFQKSYWSHHCHHNLNNLNRSHRNNYWNLQ